MSLAPGDLPPLSERALELDAVRRALLDDARAEGERIIAEARREAEAMIASATRDADAEIERERRRSEQSAVAHADRLLARSRNQASAELLRRQEQLRIELVERVRSAFLEARTDPRYPALLDRLEAVAGAQLGDRATIQRDRDPAGGIVAVAGSRGVDYRLSVLADRALDELSDEVQQLWA